LQNAEAGLRAGALFSAVFCYFDSAVEYIHRKKVGDNGGEGRAHN